MAFYLVCCFIYLAHDKFSFGFGDSVMSVGSLWKQKQKEDKNIETRKYGKKLVPSVNTEAEVKENKRNNTADQ